MDFKLVELGSDEFAYRLEDEGGTKGEIAWTKLADVMVIEHTFVEESLRHQGLAKKLLDQTANFAREHGYKLEPVCSYAVSAFDRYSDYDDVKI
ncbi:Acetyltransferase [Planococcus halocryophilus Or1]|uniref:GNAT family N-acetyltransferase n=1 Tax=Planococcus halocryophilus TaxID=1215089 RepID=A0A1C7DTV3_9BACL|nr:GNAT family N-acetyltransferase [Planococcus halocryophilus]ANU15080.1 GNAT family N-acetyltransferase [Planococcus halocryophilus]EMF45760.1 Acetyltransferase [Planococcus halocryophilus Or1]